MTQVFYKGRKRKIHIGKKGGKYVIVQGEKRYLKPKSSASKKKTKTSKRIKGGGKEYDLNDEYSIESGKLGYYVKHKPSNSSSKKLNSKIIGPADFKTIERIIGQINRGESVTFPSDIIAKCVQFYMRGYYSNSNKKKREEYNNKIRRRRNNFLNNSARYNSQRYMELLEKLENHRKRGNINEERYQYIDSKLKKELSEGVSLPTNAEFNKMINKNYTAEAKQGFFDILIELGIPGDEREQLIHDLYQRYPLPTFTEFLTILEEFYMKMLEPVGNNIEKKGLLNNNQMNLIKEEFKELVTVPFDTIHSLNNNNSSNVLAQTIPDYMTIINFEQQLINLQEQMITDKSAMKRYIQNRKESRLKNRRTKALARQRRNNFLSRSAQESAAVKIQAALRRKQNRLKVEELDYVNHMLKKPNLYL